VGEGSILKFDQLFIPARCNGGRKKKVVSALENFSCLEENEAPSLHLTSMFRKLKVKSWGKFTP